MVRYGIAAKLYLLTAISMAALPVLAAASIHFACQTKLASERLYCEGMLGIQTVTQLEVLFEQHRTLITVSKPDAAHTAVAQRYFYGSKFSYMDNVKRR